VTNEAPTEENSMANRHEENLAGIHGAGPQKYARDLDARRHAEDFFQAELAAHCPEGFAGAVVATLDVCESDSQSDYFGHSTGRKVVLGFVKSARNNFGTMRKLAGTFDRTAHLAGAKVAAFEHRQNYSMGGGLFLKEGGRHDGGWSIRIEKLEWVNGPAEFGPAAGE
jgi:hypothetical protein